MLLNTATTAEHLPAERAPRHDLQAAVELWIAANEAKHQRILELEAECARLQARVARLSRMARRQAR